MKLFPALERLVNKDDRCDNPRGTAIHVCTKEARPSGKQNANLRMLENFFVPLSLTATAVTV